MRHGIGKKLLSFVLTLAVVVQIANLPLIASAVGDDSAKGTQTSYYDVYTALGDSVGAGYGLTGDANMAPFYPQNNYYQSPADSYPQLVKKAVGASELYNMGMMAFMSEHYMSTLLDPTYVQNMYNAYQQATGIPASDCAYHYLMIDTLKQADLLTMHIGNNDMLQGLIAFDFKQFAMGDNYTQNPETGKMENLNNPFAYCLYLGLIQVLLTGNFTVTDNMTQVLVQNLELYQDDITVNHIMETLQYFSEDNITAVMSKYGDIMIQNYEQLLQLVTKGMNITKEQYDKLVACYAEADAKLETASDEAPDGALSEKEILTNGRLDITANEDGTYSVAPLNPDAQIALISCYNGYGSDYEMTQEDMQTVVAFMMKALQAILSVIGIDPGSISIKDIIDALTGRFTDQSVAEIAEGNAEYNALVSDTQNALEEEPEVGDVTLTELKLTQEGMLAVATDDPDGGDAENPGGGDTENPGGGDTENPGGGDTENPGGGDTENPGGGDTENPGGGDTENPGGGDTENPGGGDTENPGGGDTDTPDKPDNSEALKVLTALLQDIPYPVLYYMLGQPMEGGIEYTSGRLKVLASEFDVAYVDILGTPSDGDLDPHPQAAGHQYIAEQVINTVTPTVTITSGVGGNVSVNGVQNPAPIKVKYGSDLVIDIDTNEDYHVSAIYVDGVKTDISEVDGSYKLSNIRECHTVDVEYTYQKTVYDITYSAGEAGDDSFTMQALKGTSSVLPNCKFDAPEGKHFKAWLIDGKEYAPLDEYTFKGNTTVTALWEADVSYSVTVNDSFDVNTGAGEYKTGDTVTISSGLRPGYTFAGWQSDDITLDNAKEVVTTFVMPNHAVTLTATWTKNPVIKQNFIDVPEGEYYADAVDWAVENGITNGYDDDTFRPSNTCTRAEMVTFLWRAAGSPEPTIRNTQFTDISESRYYYKAVLWAVENKITNGMSDTTFEPDGTVTRGQVATFLWRMDGSPSPKIPTCAFTDVDAGEYYYNAILWAVENGITKGMTETTFEPKGGCTRGQIVTFLYRYLAE